jgi:hypothetical protein
MGLPTQGEYCIVVLGWCVVAEPLMICVLHNFELRDHTLAAM